MCENGPPYIRPGRFVASGCATVRLLKELARRIAGSRAGGASANIIKVSLSKPFAMSTACWRRASRYGASALDACRRPFFERVSLPQQVLGAGAFAAEPAI